MPREKTIEVVSVYKDGICLLTMSANAWDNLMAGRKLVRRCSECMGDGVIPFIDHEGMDCNNSIVECPHRQSDRRCPVCRGQGVVEDETPNPV